MSSDISEVLDANIVILLEEPLTQAINAVSLFEEEELASLVRKPLTVGQVLNFEATVGAATGMYQFESMRSQKTINLSPVRIEVHDYSGKTDFEAAKIPETVLALIEALHVKRAKAIGANWVVTFKSSDGTPAGARIAGELLQRHTSYLPRKMTFTGGSARLFLEDDSGMQYVLGMEPRGQSPSTDEFWMTCNANLNNPESLSVELLKGMFQQSYNLLFEVRRSLFSAYGS
jgi:hypothetical protein